MTTRNRMTRLRIKPRDAGAVALAIGIQALALSTAHAQAVPPTARPGRLPEQLQQLPPQPLATAPAISVATSANPTQAPPGADAIRFLLKSLVLEGVSAYRPEALSPFYSSMIGKDVSVADLYRVADQITAKYRNEGYLLSQAVVPAQAIHDGAARIIVVEGHIDHVTLTGDRAGDLLIKRIVDALVQDRPLRAKSLERTLLLLNDLPGVEASSVLAPAAEQLGATEMIINLKRTAVNAILATDNRGSAFAGPYQFSAGITANDGLGHDERLSARFLGATPLSELRYFDFGGQVPIGAGGATLEARILSGVTEPGSVLKVRGLRNTTFDASLGVSYPIIRSRSNNLRAAFRLDMNDTSSKGTNPVLSFEDRERVVRLSLTADAIDTWTRRPAVNLATVEISQGIEGFGATKAGVGRSRIDADPGFSKATVYLSRIQPIDGPFVAVLSASGQITGDNLASSEQIGVGGGQFGRAYDSSELVGDTGVAASLEVQYRAKGDGVIVKDWQLFGFADIGAVRTKGALTFGADRSDTLSSAGGGVRFILTKHLAGQIEADFPLDRDVQSSGNRHGRVFFSLTSQF